MMRCRRLFILRLQAEGEITAADIQHDADVEILNPDLHIAYLDEGASVNMELTANHGRGLCSL